MKYDTYETVVVVVVGMLGLSFPIKFLSDNPFSVHRNGQLKV